MPDESALTFHPVTPARWADLEALFGPQGACAGCWCMWWRLKRSDFEKQSGEGNRQALKALVDGGTVPGLLAYEGEQPIGWVSVAPREDYPVLGRSPVLKPIDDQPVWSVVCFYIEKDRRRQGMTARLLDAAVEYARQQGATIVEGYPLKPRSDAVPEMHAFVGFVQTFEEAGFVEVADRSQAKAFMRLIIEEN